ncbi:MAG: hypothetical protein OXF56_21335, partial [Rhodobacteraceae bacterium]|nr:hypothetical protein [Paracoccaceae bacterium]
LIESWRRDAPSTHLYKSQTKPCAHPVMHMRPLFVSAVLSGLLVLAGCSDNPVTGERELSLFSTSAEIDIGERYYIPLQQSGNGLYTVDPALTDYVADVGQRVAAVSARSLPYDFVVLSTGTPNAWACRAARSRSPGDCWSRSRVKRSLPPYSVMKSCTLPRDTERTPCSAAS